MLKRSLGEKIFNIFNLLGMLIFTVIIVVPVLFVFRNSFELSETSTATLRLWPEQFSLVFYGMVIKDESVYRPLMNSVFVTIVGTPLTLLVNALGAYTMSKRELPGKNFFAYYMVIIPMLIGGGTIPGFLLIRALGMIDTLWAIIIPGLASGWNMTLIRNYYWSIPNELTESARIDGASEMTIFVKIILPLSKPVLSALGLLTGIGLWNTFYAAMIYIRTPSKWTFPVKIRETVVKNEGNDKLWEEMMIAAGLDPSELLINQAGLGGAMMVVSMLPILIVYPFLQKYFAGGIMVGSVKG
ncbi:MAG TPA: carbohydrate ABC transporter permease [Clostridia bacterium]|jgi:putative aldouronate transport system permease protein|nr:carbohydrate ABC transporter permease [Clostridia bacterium]NLV34846.1 carbohydrate ABC transporter permease [Clostridiaceae bacterium]HPB16197.1 carbohydrate ABC transporter permease [Clostridia bacterium]HQM95747.1 carbohydrate ABC transporter permease [Clostridia bacterium]HQO68805.1 carbohydrate ABC transporter permease [Clostridia bacterium]